MKLHGQAALRDRRRLGPWCRHRALAARAQGRDPRPRPGELAERWRARIGGASACDVASEDSAVRRGRGGAGKATVAARILVNCAGIGSPKRIVGRDGPMPLADFERVIRVNLIGSFNMLRLAAADMIGAEPVDGERGVIISTASVAGYDGQIGQAAYSASKGGIVGMTLPMARELANSASG